MQDIIKTCDIGLLMGAPLMQNILSKIAFHVSFLLLKEKNIEFMDDAQIEVKAYHLFSQVFIYFYVNIH